MSALGRPSPAPNEAQEAELEGMSGTRAESHAEGEAGGAVSGMAQGREGLPAPSPFSTTA